VLGVGRQRAAERRELARDDVAVLRGLVLKDRDVVVAIQLDVSVVRVCELRHEHLGRCAVRRHPPARKQLLAVNTVDGASTSAARSMQDQAAHRERHAAVGEVTTKTSERHQHPELLLHQPHEPLAGHLRARVARWQRAWRRASAASSTATRRAPHHVPTLVFFDDVELPFDEFFGGVERDATAVLARVGTKRRLFGLKME
jgi:hypothetical protein